MAVLTPMASFLHCLTQSSLSLTWSMGKTVNPIPAFVHQCAFHGVTPTSSGVERQRQFNTDTVSKTFTIDRENTWISYLYLFLMLDRRFREMWSRGALPHLQENKRKTLNNKSSNLNTMRGFVARHILLMTFNESYYYKKTNFYCVYQNMLYVWCQSLNARVGWQLKCQLQLFTHQCTRHSAP